MEIHDAAMSLYKVGVKTYLERVVTMTNGLPNNESIHCPTMQPRQQEESLVPLWHF